MAEAQLEPSASNMSAETAVEVQAEDISAPTKLEGQPDADAEGGIAAEPSEEVDMEETEDSKKNRACKQGTRAMSLKVEFFAEI